ncbi:hypothetical protein BJ878DRAFT_541554 [Calycina marina]|uniref:Uncharacterized protein n=1 Tax=Calycina marina TaxID=1763456 RepID=A0A9P8CFI2_9HELO|nr:hypothetical protein BJ878DRAFT_541554 [Calycina marina]
MASASPYLLAKQKANGRVRIQMEGHPFSIHSDPVSSQPSSLVDNEKKIPTHLTRQQSAFFPWLDPDSDKRKFSLGKLKRFPLLGAAGLFGSLCTVIFSFLILHFFNNQPTDKWNFKLMPKPAALLSIVLSLNTLMIHLALSQGMAVSWWYRASQKKTTVEDMHNTWAAGSLIEALLAWKAFNYVALATVFAATLPANGILLQNAIRSVSSVIYQNSRATNFNMAGNIPVNWTSASLNNDGTVGIYNMPFSDIVPKIIAQPSFGSIITSSNLTTCEGTCYANLTGLGFNSTCSSYRLPYDLSTSEETTENGTSDGMPFSMMSVDVLWNAEQPGMITVNILQKDEGCLGSFRIDNCTLTMGQTYYSTQVIFNATVNQGAPPDYTWSHWSDDVFLPEAQDWPESIFPFTPFDILTEVGNFTSGNETAIGSLYWYTQFGGIATALQTYYDSSIVVSPKSLGDTDLSGTETNGQYAWESAGYGVGFYDDGESIAYPDCTASWTYGGDNTTIIQTIKDEVLSGMRSTFFFASIAIADSIYVDGWPITPDATNNWNTTQLVKDAGQMKETVIYRVVWKWWAASLAVTLAVILFVLPTFWGFWTLARRTTLSPFETARAFHAPIIQDAPPNLDTKELLRTVGNKNLHTDLIHSPITSPLPAHNGSQAPVGYFLPQLPFSQQQQPQQFSPQRNSGIHI